MKLDEHAACETEGEAGAIAKMLSAVRQIDENSDDSESEVLIDLYDESFSVPKAALRTLLLRHAAALEQRIARRLK